MPAVEVIFYQDAEGKMPRLIEWLDALSPKARVKCLVRLKRLEDLGHELRRPEADFLRDGIYMKKKRQFNSPALQFAYNRYAGADGELSAAFEDGLSATDVASQIYKLRSRSGLSQRQLAAKVGTTASVICRLEDADYEGHSLSMLRRIATALGREVKIIFVPSRRRATA
jgi:DNA-binding XRE family transcriptional regulator